MFVTDIVGPISVRCADGHWGLETVAVAGW